MRNLWISAALLSLAGCATVNPPTVAVQVSCLPMTTYTAEQEKTLASAVSLLAPDSPLLGAIEDYGAMRAADRACLSTNKGPKP